MLACETCQTVWRQEEVNSSPVTVMCQCSSVILLIGRAVTVKYDSHFMDEESKLW